VARIGMLFRTFSRQGALSVLTVLVVGGRAQAQPAPPARPSADVAQTPAPPSPVEAPEPAAEAVTPAPALTGTATVAAESSDILQRLDQVLIEAAADLGLHTAALLPAAQDLSPASVEARLTTRSAPWVVQPVLERQAQGYTLRLWARGNDPRLQVLSVPLNESDLEVTAISALRRVTSPLKGNTEAPKLTAIEPKPTSSSQGLPILGATGVIVGGYLGFALERVGHNPQKPGLVYPIIALGAGIGFGTAMIICGEWDISTGEAWYLSAATLWPTAAATLIATYPHKSPSGSDYSYGFVGTFAGLALGTLALQKREPSETDAILVNSGGFFGGILGGVAQRIVDPLDGNQPFLGAGIGIASGVLATGLISLSMDQMPWERVVYADLGAALGALSGAALASPFLAGRRIDGKENRLWAASAGAGLLLGATLGVLLAPSSSASPSKLVSGLRGWSPSFGPSPFAQVYEQSTVLSLRHAL
jgi:hypothetical protein